MIIEPKTRGFICTTSHPVGCGTQVQKQIDYVRDSGAIKGPQNVLVIGASTGYGLASRITASFGCGAKTIGVFFEKAASGKRTASAGWYNTAAFEKAAREAGYYAASVNGDAFSDEIKQQTIDLIKQDMGQVDLIIYSLATPRRTDPKTGTTYSSALKTVGAPYTNKSVDPLAGKITEVSIEPGTQEEIDNTVKVMGGEDWVLWVEALQAAGALADGVKTVAYSYIGPKITYPMYREGTIGKAKDHLEATAHELTKKLANVKGQAFVSVNKAVVTQSSAAIPIVPLYISILFKVMKEKNLHEGCIEQIYRLCKERLYANDSVPTDEKGLIRIDDWEMRDDVQAAVAEIWPQVTDSNLNDITDLMGYRHDFYNLFGFDVEGIDYQQDVNQEVEIDSLRETIA